MICKEYFPAYTHSYNDGCENCKYRGYSNSISTCRNVNVLAALQKNSKIIKQK